jgi:hypothetical protein
VSFFLNQGAGDELTVADNAYVAGMKEELGFYGNQLVHLQVICTIGVVVGQRPSPTC